MNNIDSSKLLLTRLIPEQKSTSRMLGVTNLIIIIIAIIIIIIIIAIVIIIIPASAVGPIC